MNDEFGSFILFIIIISIIGIGMIYVNNDIIKNKNELTENIFIGKLIATVDGKEYGSSDSVYQYKIYTNIGVFYVSDNVYYQLREDKKYYFYCYGSRIAGKVVPCYIENGNVYEFDEFKKFDGACYSYKVEEIN